MKMKLFFRISMLALCISMSLSSFADDKKDRISVEVIDWSKNNQSLTSIVSTSNETKKIYLYAATPKKFVTVGGRYGAQPILAEVGMNFYVEKVAANDERYYIHSWVNNPTTSHETGNADYLGVKPAMDDDERIFSVANDETKKSIYLFVDRGKENRDDNEAYPSPDRVKWYIEAVNGTTTGYKIYSKWKDNQEYSDNEERKYYLSYYQGPTEEKPQKKFLVVTTDESKAETFYFINIDDYRNVINSQNKKYINVSGLVQDARFERNNKGIAGDLRGDYNDESKNVWQFRYNRNGDTYVFPNLQDNVEELAYMTAWVGPKGDLDGQTGNYLIQKITGLKPGLYRVNCQGFYFNPNSQNDKDNTSFVFASQDYNDISNKTTLKTIEPADWDLMRPTGGPVTISDGSKAHESVDFTPVTGGYDLVVTKVFVSNKKEGEAIYTGDELVMGAVIANAGDKEIPAGTKIGIQFQMDGKTYDKGFVTWCDNFDKGLKSHETATLIANGGGGSVTTGGKDNYFIAPEGSHTITAWVDDTNDWDEGDYENNNTNVMNLIAYGLNGFKNIKIKYCVSAGKIFAESNPYEDKDVDSRKYDNSVAVLVKADKGSETGTLYIGAGKGANEGGYAFFDNFQLFYMGDKQWYLDATNTSTSEFTTTKNTDDYYTPSGINRNPKGDNYYEYPVTYNIRRYFNVGQWESLILPCTLTGDQVKQTFGGDGEVKLSVFDRVEGTCVYFRAVDPDNEGIVAGKPYIIKVGKEADIKTKNDEYTFPWGNNTTVKVKGPIYQVKGVVPPTFTGDGVTTEEEISGGYKVQFHGFYYDPGAAPANAYVVNNGDMYHLSTEWNSFVGTSWYVTITDAQGNAKALSFSFDGDSSTTAIENVAGQEDAAVQADGFVYNLSGQRVGTRNNMSNLSSGIYVVAGKKFVVK